MIATFDLNVVVDDFANRASFASDSQAALGLVEKRVITGVFAAHAITTLYYILRKAVGFRKAELAVEYVLDNFEIWGAEKEDWRSALEWRFEDFEDAAIAKVAELSESHFIVTRDQGDFVKSSVPTITPAELVRLFASSNPAGPQTPP